MSNPFTQSMSERSDKQLVDIVTLHRNDYQAEALQAAEEELLRRNLDVNTFYNQEQLDALQTPVVIPPEEQTLSTLHKVGIVLLPALTSTITTFAFTKLGQTALTKFLNLPLTILVMYGVYYRLKEDGKTRMAEAFKVWSNYTIIIYVAVFVLAAVLIFVTD